jgi:HEPN domain-containing protein
MLDQTEFDRWCRMAFDAADTADGQVERAAHWACFLTEQASQFICKGLFHGLGLPAWGHDPVDLGERLRTDAGLRVDGEIMDALARLSRHYIATRYPDAHAAGTPSAHYRRVDAEQAVVDARHIIDFVDRQWSLLIKDAEDTEGAIDAE